MARAGVHLGCNDGGLGALVLDLSLASGFGLSFGLSLSLRLLLLGVHSDLDGDGPSTDLLALERLDSLGLSRLVANVDEAVALALTGLSPAAADDAGGVDSDARLGEDGGELLIADSEAEVRNEEHGLGGLASRLLTGSAWGARSAGLALAGLLLTGLTLGTTLSGGCLTALDGLARLRLAL